jgi:hypothetical protein
LAAEAGRAESVPFHGVAVKDDLLPRLRGTEWDWLGCNGRR